MKKLTFDDYLHGKGRSGGEWIVEPTGLAIYVRRAIRVKGGYGLANLDVPEELQHQGILKRFLEKHMQLPLRIENVVHPKLEAWLLSQQDWIIEEIQLVGLSASYINIPWFEICNARKELVE